MISPQADLKTRFPESLKKVFLNMPFLLIPVLAFLVLLFAGLRKLPHTQAFIPVRLFLILCTVVVVLFLIFLAVVAFYGAPVDMGG